MIADRVRWRFLTPKGDAGVNPSVGHASGRKFAVVLVLDDNRLRNLGTELISVNRSCEDADAG